VKVDSRLPRWVLLSTPSLAVLLGATVGLAPVRGTAVVFGAVLLVVAFIRPKEAVFFILAYGLLQFGWTRTFQLVPETVALADDVALLGLGLRLLVDIVSRRVWLPSWWMIGVVGWLGVATFTWLARSLPAEQSLLALRGVWLPVVVSGALFCYLVDVRDRRGVVKLIIAVAAIEGVLAVTQWLANPTNPDAAYGLLGPGGANLLGYQLAISATVIISIGSSSWRTAVRALPAVAGLVATSARSALLVFPMVLLAANVRRLRLRTVLVLSLATAAAVAGVGTYYSTAGRSVEQDLSPRRLLESQRIGERGGRLLYAAALPEVLDRLEGGWLIGAGPGQFTSFVGVTSRAPLLVLNAPPSSQSQTGYAHADIQWVAILGEYGLLGLACAMTLVIGPVVASLKTEDDGDEMLRSLRASLPAVAALVVVGSTANNFLEFQPTAYLWWSLSAVAMGGLARTSRDKEVSGDWKL